MQQSFHPGPGHPAMPHGQPMGMPGGPHVPGGQMMPHMPMQMGGPNAAHMGQGGPMMVNMHPGAGIGGPGGNNAHALSHLQPQATMFRPPQMGVPGMPQNPMASQAMLARNRVMMGGQPQHNLMMNMQNMQNMQNGGMTPAVMAQYQQRLQQQQQQNGLPGGLQFNPGLVEMQRTMQARMGQQQQQNLMHNIAMQHAASQQNHPGPQNHAPQMRPQSSMQGVRPQGMPDGPQIPQQPPMAQPPNQPMHPGTPQQAQRPQAPAAQQAQLQPPHQTPVQAPAPAPNRQATATPQQPAQQNAQAQQQTMQQNVQAQQAMLASQAAQKQAAQQQEQLQQQPAHPQPANQQQVAAASAAATAQGVQNQQQLMQQAQQQQAAQQQQNAMQQQEKLRQGQVAMMQQQRIASVMSQSAVSRLAHFTDRLGMFSTIPGQDVKDVYRFWQHLVQEFFAEEGVFRATLIDKHSVHGDAKVFEISTALLARFFLEQNKVGVERILIGVNGAQEHKLANNSHFLNSKRSTFTFIYRGGVQVVWTGVLKAMLGPENKFTFFDFSPEAAHEEYLSRSIVEKLLPPESPTAIKTSPNVTKSKAKQQKVPPPTLASLPESPVGGLGVSGTVQQFLEMAQTMSFFRDIIDGSIQNVDLKPKVVLERINERTTEQLIHQQSQPQFPVTTQLGQGPTATAMRAATLNGQANNQHQFSSPAHLNLNLPGGRTMNATSPHMIHENSNQGSMPPPGAVPMTAQRSTQGNTSSTAASVNASPNASGKRRRASTVNKGGDNHDGGDGDPPPKVKPSPKVGGKRQKGNAA